MKIYIAIIALVISIVLLSGCVDNTIPPGWPPETNPVASPVITSISPADSAVGGVLDITINGSNFGAAIDQCVVYFGTETGVMTSFTSNKIVARRPVTYGESVSTRVVVLLADDVAQKNYKIKKVVSPFATFPGAALSNTIASDNSGNIYLAFTSVHDSSNTNRVIRRLTPNGANPIVSDYALHPVGLTVSCMRVAPNGTIYLLMTGSGGEFHSIPPGGGSSTKLFGFQKNMLCFDFGQDGTIYAGGPIDTKNAINIVPPGSTTFTAGPSYPKHIIRALRVFSNYVYVLAEVAKTDTINVQGVYRHLISGGSLGAQELVLAWSATGDYANSKFKDLTFSANGDIYIATDKNSDPILLVNYNSSSNAVTGMRSLYKNLITTGSCGGLTWTGNIIYDRVVPPVTGSDPSIIAIDMGNPGAPYYGR
ncbi:MAG: IPT/TIG domain-containing protein [Ignavibacteriales bacterium]|nr:IPT/TIG domain-containing protein [Ignavibacteriales bacterium]